MLEDTVQDRIGLELRAMYGDIPKGAIPDVLWTLLLLIERKHDLGSDEGLPSAPVLNALAEWCRKRGSNSRPPHYE